MQDEQALEIYCTAWSPQLTILYCILKSLLRKKKEFAKKANLMSTVLSNNNNKYRRKMATFGGKDMFMA